MDDLLDSIDLSTYSLARTKLKEQIGLDSSESELDPQNPNPRGVHGEEEEKDPLDEIIRTFNERWFQGWDATPEEQKVKLINIAQHVMSDANYEAQVLNNPDKQNSQLALEKIIESAINKERRRELDLYRNYAQDPEFKRAFDASIARLLAQNSGVVQQMLSQL
jgi:type I restriction enzyme R subunit